jgi:hypothetical protein
VGTRQGSGTQKNQKLHLAKKTHTTKCSKTLGKVWHMAKKLAQVASLSAKFGGRSLCRVAFAKYFWAFVIFFWY